MFISSVNDTGDKLSAVSTIPLKDLSLVSTTQTINLCDRFLVIGGVVDTGDKFIMNNYRQR
jgi:hypothetical protein